MKTIFPFLITFFFASCSTVKVLKVSSDEVKPTTSGYVYENDTLKITYRFWAQKGKMDFDVYNKTSQPIYIDWKTSAFIPNDKMLSYWRDETNTDASSSAYVIAGIASGSAKSKSVRAERIIMIPPKSMVTQQQYSLATKYKELPEGTYDKNNSPVKFRNYLTISPNEKLEGKASFIDNEFYISEVKKTSSSKYEKHKNEKAFYYFMSYSN